MEITRDHIKLIQDSLNRHYQHNLVVDGIAGPKTMKAVTRIPAVPSVWKKKDRKLIGYIQHICHVENIDAGPIDGFWGPQTDQAYDILVVKLKTGNAPDPWRDDEGIGAQPVAGDWPIQTQDQLFAYYGDVGENQTRVKCPYPLKIAWNLEQTVTRFSCHEKVAPSIERVLTRVVDHYGYDQIVDLGLDLWGGCLNVRPLRGGTRYSTHSWGISIDWDPARNRLRWDGTKAELAKPVYDQWWKLWEEEGWISLGRVRDYDWMHVQAAKVK